MSAFPSPPKKIAAECPAARAAGRFYFAVMGFLIRETQFSVSMPGAGAAHLCRVQDSGFQQAGAVQNIWNVASQLSGKPKYFLSAKGCALSACLNALSIRYLLSSGNNA